jgi:NAD(P)H-hydrate epimerase
MKSVSITHIKKLLPKRKKTDSKMAGGKCLIIAGSKRMPGAAILAARAAARSGSGYVYLATDIALKNSLKNPDFIILDINKKLPLHDFSSIAIGPGLGKNRKILSLIKNIKSAGLKNVVMDADALNVLSKNQKQLPLPSSWIVTPHTGELSRLLGEKISPTERKKNLNKAQAHLGCILLLKGNPTFVANSSESYSVNAGNKALAKAGTGDVLTGIIAGLLAQGLKPMDAAIAGALLHGSIADEWVKSKDYVSLMASDLVERIPETLYNLRTKKIK